MTQLEKHEKAVKLLVNINNLKIRIYMHETYGNNPSWVAERIAIDTAIRTRLENYYNLKFKI